jgi:hypothetical protein
VLLKEHKFLQLVGWKRCRSDLQPLNLAVRPMISTDVYHHHGSSLKKKFTLEDFESGCGPEAVSLHSVPNQVKWDLLKRRENFQKETCKDTQVERARLDISKGRCLNNERLQVVEGGRPLKGRTPAEIFTSSSTFPPFFLLIRIFLVRLFDGGQTVNLFPTLKRGRS